MIEKKPFVNYTTDEEKKAGYIVISLKLNKEEQGQLIKDKNTIKQLKDGTAIKQLWKLGSKVVHDDKIGDCIKLILDNDRKNQRLGIHDFD